MKNVTVVLGLIEHNNQILLGQKIQGKHPANLGGRWFFPGGQVKEGENPKIALKREIKEETNLEIEIKDQLGVYVWEKQNATAKLIYFRRTPKSFDCIPADDLQDLKWITKQEVLKQFDKDLVETVPSKVVKFLRK